MFLYKRIERTVYGKDAAKNMELQLMESVKKEPSRASRMTVKDLYAQYMDAKKTEMRATTWDKSRRNLEYYILPSLGDVKLSNLSAVRLQERWTDIDGNILHVRRSVTQKLNGDDVETPPKNKSSYRDLQIPKPMMDILEEHREVLTENGIYKDNDRICGGDRCRGIIVQGDQRIFFRAPV